MSALVRAATLPACRLPRLLRPEQLDDEQFARSTRHMTERLTADPALRAFFRESLIANGPPTGYRAYVEELLGKAEAQSALPGLKEPQQEVRWLERPKSATDGEIELHALCESDRDTYHSDGLRSSPLGREGGAGGIACTFICQNRCTAGARLLAKLVPSCLAC